MFSSSTNPTKEFFILFKQSNTWQRTVMSFVRSFVQLKILRRKWSWCFAADVVLPAMKLLVACQSIPFCLVAYQLRCSMNWSIRRIVVVSLNVMHLSCATSNSFICCASQRSVNNWANFFVVTWTILLSFHLTFLRPDRRKISGSTSRRTIPLGYNARTKKNTLTHTQKSTFSLSLSFVLRTRVSVRVIPFSSQR